MATISVLFRSEPECAHSASVSVRLTAPDWSDAFVARVGEIVHREVPQAATVQLRAYGPNWVELVSSLDPSDRMRDPIVLPLSARAALTGRVVADGGTPVTDFELFMDSRLDDQGGHVYRASARSVQHEVGLFCALPSQASFANRLRIEARGYLPLTTPWIGVTPGFPTDLGTLGLERDERPLLTVKAISAETASALDAVQVICAARALTAADLRIVQGRLHVLPGSLRQDEVTRCSTDSEGMGELRLPGGGALWVAAWRSGSKAAIRSVARPTGPSGTAPLVLALESGGTLHVEVVLDEPVARALDGLKLEVHGVGPEQSLDLHLGAAGSAIEGLIRGLEPGMAEVRLIGIEIDAGGRPAQSLIAREFLAISGVGPDHLLLDCSAQATDWRVDGFVIAPEGESFRNLVAFHCDDPAAALPTRSVPVRDGRFSLSCPVPSGYVGVHGTSASGTTQALWLQAVGPLLRGGPIDVDLSSPIVVIHSGDLGRLPIEEVTVRPAMGHALHGVEAARVDIVLEAGGEKELTLYGLPAGPWKAEGIYTGRRSEFAVQRADVVEVILER